MDNLVHYYRCWWTIVSLSTSGFLLLLIMAVTNRCIQNLKRSALAIPIKISQLASTTRPTSEYHPQDTGTSSATEANTRQNNQLTAIYEVAYLKQACTFLISTQNFLAMYHTYCHVPYKSSYIYYSNYDRSTQ